MLHTLVGPNADAVEQVVRQPMKDYLRSAVFLVKAAAWQFPTFKKLSEDQGKSLDEFFASISAQDMDDLLEFAFLRYYKTSGLFGTPEQCLEMVKRVEEADADEIACLIDFGIDTAIVLEHLQYLEQLRVLAQAPARSEGDHSLAGLLRNDRRDAFSVHTDHGNHAGVGSGRKARSCKAETHDGRGRSTAARSRQDAFQPREGPGQQHVWAD